VAGKLLAGGLRPGSAVQVDDNVDSVLLAPSDQTIEVGKPTAGVVLAIPYEILIDPEANGDTNGVETDPGNLLDIVLRSPRIPVGVEGFIRGCLTNTFGTCPLIVVILAAHLGPRVFGHPSFDNELTAEVHTADLVDVGEVSLCENLASLSSDGYLLLASCKAYDESCRVLPTSGLRSPCHSGTQEDRNNEGWQHVGRVMSQAEEFAVMHEVVTQRQKSNVYIYKKNTISKINDAPAVLTRVPCSQRKHQVH
jgi:hypothetical protein